MIEGPRFGAALLTLLVLAGCSEGETLQDRVSATISTLKIDNTGIDEQGRPRVSPQSDAPEAVEATPPSPDEVRFADYAAGPAYARRLVEAAITSDAYLGRDCPRAYTVTPLAVLHQPDPPLAMPEGAEHPAQGIWRQRYEVERCGEKRTYNAVFGARSEAPPNMRISTPGTTTAGSELAREMRADIQEIALEYAGMSRCSDQRIVDTAAQPMRREVQSDGSVWSEYTEELWTIDVCGRLVEIALHHGFRDGVGYPQYVIADADDPAWRPSGRSVPKDIDLPRLQAALLQVASGKAGASLDYLWAEARREVPFAQTVIAGLLRDGTAMPRDMDRSAFWALRASYGGYPGAMEMVGDLYASGAWIVPDRRLAAAWYRRAIESGSRTAAEKLKVLAVESGAQPPARATGVTE
jgi:hypothetical protein